MNRQAQTLSPSDVTLSSVSKSFGTLEAVSDVSFTVPAGTFFSLLGPSGCGKSTTLRLIAGFEIPDSGRISIGAEDVTRVAPQKRPTAMVFQNYALFPHMTVGENVEYGLRVRRFEKSERSDKAKAALARVGMDALVNTRVTELSGGQQQRVALARAIAIQPAVILFDEPLSNLDVALREQTRSELKQMQHSLGITSIYVTHDQEEALSLSDELAVMRDGSIVQLGPPEELYRAPATAFVARFLGGSNLIRGEAATKLGGNSGPDKHVLAIRPENFSFNPEGKFVGKVVDKQFLGSTSTVWLQSDGVRLRASAASETILDGEVRFDISSVRWVLDDLGE